MSSAPPAPQESQKPKRKRLAKICVYTDSSGQAVPPPIERTASSSNGSGLLNGVGSSDVNTPSEPRKRKATQPPPAVSDNHSRPANSNYPPPPPPDAAAPPFYHSDPNRSSSGLTRSSESHSMFPGERSPQYHAQQQSGPRVDPAVVHELVNYVKTNPNHWSGEKYANAAKALLFEPGGQLKERPCLEVAQALTFITMHDCIGRQAGRRTDYFQQLALDILVDIGVHSFDVVPPTPFSPLARDEWIRRETSRRLFYLIYVVELLASIFTHRPIAHREQDLRIFLPAPEAYYDLTLVDVPLSREYLLPLAPPDGSRSKASEFGYLIRIVAVYTRISDNIFACKHAMDEDAPPHAKPNVAEVIRDGENALKTWESSLPENLAFNERNLQHHLGNLEAGASISGWCYCYMHIVAECCVLALQEAAELDTTRSANRSKSPAQTREHALENLKTVLQALGPRERKCIMMGCILEAATRHTLIATRGRPDPVLTGYCSDYEAVWGINYEQLTSLEFRKQWVPDWPQDRLTAPRKASGSSSSTTHERDWIYGGRSIMPNRVGGAPTTTAAEGDSPTSSSPRATTEAYWSSSAKEPPEPAWGSGEGRDRPPWWRGPPRSPSPTSSSQASYKGVPTPLSANYSSASPRERGIPDFNSSSQQGGSSNLMRSRTYPTAPAGPSHEHKNSIGSSREGTVREYDDRETIQLPPLPLKYASADGENNFIPRAKPGGTSLPSIHSVGLLNSLPPDSHPRQLPPPSSLGREEGPSS
ncbi:hypothetical protein FRC04_000658 [Tulasnella sp. 424]|nr:hypothetical protein FRC04_000658 [Tulasnella sp. 424]